MAKASAYAVNVSVTLNFEVLQLKVLTPISHFGIHEL